MISRFLIACGVGALLGTATPLSAQDVGPPEVLVDALTQGARVNLAKARLPDGSNVPAETPEELAQPIAPRELEVQTIERALLSAYMNTCDLDSEGLSFRPYMAALRASERYSEKQLAYIGVLHGFAMAWLGEGIDPSECNDALNKDMVREVQEAIVATP